MHCCSDKLRNRAAGRLRSRFVGDAVSALTHCVLCSTTAAHARNQLSQWLVLLQFAYTLLNSAAFAGEWSSQVCGNSAVLQCQSACQFPYNTSGAVASFETMLGSRATWVSCRALKTGDDRGCSCVRADCEHVLLVPALGG